MLVNGMVNSYKQLPLLLYQICISFSLARPVGSLNMSQLGNIETSSDRVKVFSGRGSF